MTKLLLVDGTNIAMRAAFGGEKPPEESTSIATGLIRRAAIQVGATHMVIALDDPAPSWRLELYPDYKANRTTNTTPWIEAVHDYWANKLFWYVIRCPGFEADDIIATIANRTGLISVYILSNDSDLCSLAGIGTRIVKPENGGSFSVWQSTEICIKYGIPDPDLLPDLKALTGESGDNIPGVPGIGPKRAEGLIEKYGHLEFIIAAGLAQKCKHSITVAKHADTARLALKLNTLNNQAPIRAIRPRECQFR